MLLWLVALGVLILGVAGVIPMWAAWPLFGVTVVGASASLPLTIRRVRRRNIESSTAELIGKIAVVREPLTPRGVVVVRGERWEAVLDAGEARVGERVRVVGATGLCLNVRREPGSGEERSGLES